MRNSDATQISKATVAAIKALRPHFNKLVAHRVNRDHIWWELMEALDGRAVRKPRPSSKTQDAKRERAERAREGKAKKHGYFERNQQMKLQFERSLEMGEKPASIRRRLADFYDLTPRRISMICSSKK